ncbi:hypothetical protein D3C73_1224190 [compost metagenome]
MMKNILNIDIYLQSRIDITSYSEKIAALSNTLTFPNTFQKVQIKSLIFSDGTK